LEGISLSELPLIITNPFQLPPISLDDGHHGVDFAFYQFKQFSTMEGLPIHAVLPGRVAAVDINRPPYGNMVIIETPLEQVPVKIQNDSQFPTPAPTAVNDGRLSCPASGPSPTYNPSSRSLYILYAHMKNPPTLKVDDKVSLCQEIGQVGSTGESSQFHLHLETRIGPSEARFTSIAHRDTSATEEEMYNYCVWRISNIFQKFDPMQLLSLQP
jgi:murein DD-endopeptidase MepM/ murein hydrolase activator NlpD